MQVRRHLVEVAETGNSTLAQNPVVAAKHPKTPMPLYPKNWKYCRWFRLIAIIFRNHSISIAFLKPKSGVVEQVGSTSQPLFIESALDFATLSLTSLLVR